MTKAMIKNTVENTIATDKKRCTTVFVYVVEFDDDIHNHLHEEDLNIMSQDSSMHPMMN